MAKKKKIKIWLPVYASAEFECEVDTSIGNYDRYIDDIAEEFLDYCTSTGGLCHYCNRKIETDLTINEIMFSNRDEDKYAIEDLRDQIKSALDK